MDQNFEHIRRIDIELHSFCNRTCEWCPNKTYLRNKQVRMEDWLFEKIIKELKEAKFGVHRRFWGKQNTAEPNGIDYQRKFTNDQPVLSFLGYMEPMADMKNFRSKLKYAIEHLPKHIEFLSHTNGDYLKKENLEDLPLTTLGIMDYDNMGSKYWAEKLTELGCLVMDSDQLDPDTAVLALHKSINNIRVVSNWTENVQIENRAGVLGKDEEVIKMLGWRNDAEKRVVPCAEPTYFMNITYDGYVMPCCHMRADIPEHKDYILGNVKDQSLLEIYFSEKAKDFREKLSVENGDYPDPCKNCQKHRSGTFADAPNGFEYLGARYRDNKIHEEVKFT